MEPKTLQNAVEPVASPVQGPILPVPSCERSVGKSRISLAYLGGRTRLTNLRHEGCSKLYLLRSESGRPEIVQVNTAGGLTGGDSIETCVSVGPGGSASVTTQAAERIYRSSGPPARVKTSLSVSRDARLEWLPQETILFNQSSCRRELTAEIAANSSLLLVEALVFGRTAMGETLRSIEFRDVRRVVRGGTLIYTDSFRAPESFHADAGGSATLRGATAVAGVTYIAPDAEDRLDWALSNSRHLGVQCGVSAWNGMLVARLLASRSDVLRRALVEFLIGFRGEALPRVWTM